VEQQYSFEEGLDKTIKTIKWYKENEEWWKNKINNDLS